MTAVTTSTPQSADALDQLAEHFLEAWSRANGVTGSRVEVLTGEDRCAILIEDAFTQAERALAEHESADFTLRRYLNGLMNVISEDAIATFGGLTGREAHSLGTDVNFDQSWVMWYIRLGEAQA